MNKQSMDLQLVNASEIITRYKPLVQRVVCKVVKNKMDAEEVVQDCLLKVLDKLNYYNPEKGGFEAWLSRLVKNTALDFINKKEYRLWNLSTDKIPEKSINTDEPDRRLKICNYFLQNTLDELSEVENKIIRLLYLENKNYKEVAECLDLKIEHVRVLKHRAIEKLKKIAESKKVQPNKYANQ